MERTLENMHPPWGRYVELRPDALAAIRAVVPVAFLPWGSLAWHGPHLPLGLDGMVAESIAQQVIRRTGGVLLPTTWWPIAPLPHPESLAIESSVIRPLWGNIFTRLAQARWQIVVVMSGHYSQGHELVLMDAAEEAIQRHDLLVLALPPLALVDETMLDQGALWETSLMMALRPDLVDLSALGEERLTPKESGVIGHDPRGTASISLGEAAMTMAVERIVKAVEQLLSKRDAAPLYALYAERRTRYHAYIERYQRGSPEEAMRHWWHEVIAKLDTSLENQV